VAGVTLHKGEATGSQAILDDRVALEVDASIYSQDAVLRAAYKFTDRCYVFIEHPGNFVVALTPKDTLASRALIGEFCNELLDQQVRESLSREFGDLRTLIVAQAFAEGNLLDKERDEGNYQADPLGIGKRR
jgi:His-Xaa-Ser system protein HxsD